MARIVYYVAASLDGFIADSAGGVDWLPSGESNDYRYAEFYAGVEALVMGRRTYDQALSFGEWPYPGKPAYVFTQSPPGDGPQGVQFVRGAWWILRETSRNGTPEPFGWWEERIWPTSFARPG